MSIRQKMLFAMAVSLFLAFTILGTAFLAVILEKTRSLAEETKSFYAVMTRNVIAAFNLDARERGEEMLRDLLPSSPLVKGWLIADEDGGIIAHAFPAAYGLEAGVHAAPETLGRLGVNTEPAVVLQRGRRRWTLYVASPEWAYLPADAGMIVLALFVGMLIVMGVAFGITESLVITPLASLAAASRLLHGGAMPPPIPGSARKDEVGELIRSFEAMAKEVMDYRQNMEQKVESETAKRLDAEKGLILAQRLSATSRLAAGIAHEINNPLAGVVNAVRALQRGGLPEDKKAEYFGLVLEGLSRIEEIVARMLAFQRGRPTMGVVRLPDVVETALSLASGPKLKNAKLLKNLEDTTVFGDKGELVQALLNIVLNAADAVAGAEQPCIRISTESNGAEAVVNVLDNGCGMSDEVRGHAFDLFFSGKEGGTGLGLAITHVIIENHGGRIAIDSSPGQGTAVTVRLPAEKGEAR
ncbi:MAG TPA: HAMP domain-containing histidine kinase [Planctomycetes bacterium]|nr:HAMP domain-containing histidine kinase [Planctomycetota bacterium]